MAGFLRNLFGTADENEGFVDYENESYDTSSSAVTNEEAYSSSYSEPKSYTSSSSSKFVNIGTGSAAPTKIKILKPKSYEEVIEVAVDLIREGTTIFINLNGLSNDICIRIVDFMTGVTAAFQGDIKKVDAYCYAAAPKNVDLIDSID